MNVERQDIGVTLRVTPQITEGDSLRLEIFQEITEINDSAPGGVGNAEDVGVALSNRRVENTVVVRDGETVVIGGLLSDTLNDTVTKVPWLGDIPILGWLFKSTTTDVRKTNLLVFLTPRIVRTPLDLENDSIRRREEFREHSGPRARALRTTSSRRRRARVAAARERGRALLPEHDDDEPVRERLAGHAARYPRRRVQEIETIRAEERAKAAAQPRSGPALPGPGGDARRRRQGRRAAHRPDRLRPRRHARLGAVRRQRRLRDPARAVRDARAGERGRRGGAQVAQPHPRDRRRRRREEESE